MDDGPRIPIDTQSNFQSRTDFLTKRTILLAVMVGPDGILRGSFWPVASSLMLVPPTSMTRIFGDLFVQLSCALLREVKWSSEYCC